MEIRIYSNGVPQASKIIREEVFVNEQGFKEEFDLIDKVATHIVVYDNEKPIATARFYKKTGYYLIGRIAVSKEFRGKDVGSFVLQSAEDEIKKIGGEMIVIHAQKRAIKFYLKNNYMCSDKEDEEEGCPHVWMFKHIS